MERAHAYRLIDSAHVQEILSPIGDIQPTSESQTRPLTRLRERWDMSRPRAYQLIESSDAMDVVSTIVDIQPTN